MNDNDFIRQQQAAVERMREFNSRSMYKGSPEQKMPPVPPFVKVPGGNRQQTNNYQQAQKDLGSDTKHEYKNGKNKDNAKTVEETHGINSFFDGLNLPFLDMFKKDGDMTLIIGLLLILLSEKADKKLLFALIYILL